MLKRIEGGRLPARIESNRKGSSFWRPQDGSAGLARRRAFLHLRSVGARDVFAPQPRLNGKPLGLAEELWRKCFFVQVRQSDRRQPSGKDEALNIRVDYDEARGESTPGQQTEASDNPPGNG